MLFRERERPTSPGLAPPWPKKRQCNGLHPHGSQRHPWARKPAAVVPRREQGAALAGIAGA